MKKLLSLILCGAMLLTLTACDSKGNSSDNSIVQNFDPVPVPEGGWTLEELVKTICIDGKPIPDPFKVDALGKKYSLGKDGETNSGAFLKRNNMEIAVILFTDSSNSDGRKKEIKNLLTLEKYNEEKFTNAITINGVGLGSSSADFRTNLGEFVIIDQSIYDSGYTAEYYEDGRDMPILHVSFDDYDRAHLLSFYFK